MSLSAADRKNLSKKYITIPDENAAATINISNLNTLITDYSSQDSTYKVLFDTDNNIIDLYQPEINYLAGEVRTSVTETDIQNSANKIKGNYFFPNDTSTTTPSLSDGVWKQIKSYARNIAVGKDYQETYASQDSETTKMNAVSSLTSSIQSTYSQSLRQTDSPTNSAMEADLVSLEAAVTAWKSYLTSEQTVLTNNTDTIGAADIATALTNVGNALTQIADWQALTDYAVGGKLDDSGLAILNNEITTRTSEVTTRISQINTRLGDITQNDDGTLASSSGLYSSRYINIDARINLAQGTLSKQTGLDLAKKVQSETIINNNNYLSYLQTNVLIATKLTADGNGTNIITVADTTGFSVSDTIYLITETQTELTGTITNISGNDITLSFTVSSAYTVADLARLVKQV